MRRFKAVCHALLGLVVGAVVACAAAPADAACLLSSASSKVKHIIFLQFDNVHLSRDNPNVPSDLEQMPNLMNFLRNNGLLDSNHHTPLISHTADDIVTTLTGVYGDRHGIPVANSFGVFNRAPGTTNSVSFPSSFAYWTETVQNVVPDTQDPLPIMLTRDDAGNLKMAPAPWVPFTRAGCDFGAYSTANIEFERVPSDVIKVYGKGSPQAAEDTDHQTADFVGVAVHCAQGSPKCSAANHGEPDLLPDEPGGYTKYKALFGAKYVAPAVGHPAGITDLDGNVIKCSSPDACTVPGLVGFPGFNPTASQTLGALAEMQEAGVPVTFGYISAAHEDSSGNALGPGSKVYEAQLKSYNQAWGKFFARLAKDGINQNNTLFIITADEGDHFVGGPPSPAGCDGVTTPCTYSKIGELDINLNGLASAHSNSTPFDIHFDSAPTVYIHGDQPVSDFFPESPDPKARGLELTLGGLTAKNPLTGKIDNLMAAMADPVEEKLLHMVTADPQRTPNFTYFGDPDYYFESFGSITPMEYPPEAWNHGDFQHEIVTTWLGLVGPGVLNLGETAQIFSDHTDVRPTILALAHLKDDYAHDGRVLIEAVDPLALPASVRTNSGTLQLLGELYKQLNAAVGQLGLDTLKVSTAALTSKNSATYTDLEDQLQSWTDIRDGLAEQMRDMLETSVFEGKAIDPAQAESLIDQGQDLLNQVHFVANP